MTIIPHINDLWDHPTTANPLPIAPISVSHLPEAPGVMAAPSEWLAGFRAFLNESAPNFSESKPVVINMGTPLLQFPLSYDDPKFVATFGRILRFREDTRRLASTVLYALNKQYNLNLDASATGIPADKFYGAHLRTAADAAAGGWTPYAIQSGNYLDSATSHYLPIIYLACGNPTDRTLFTSTATNMNITVLTKREILSDPEFSDELAEMESLTWDQQALIDWEVLLRSSMFGGTWESSFAWNIALRRHVVVGGGTWIGRGKEIPFSQSPTSLSGPSPTLPPFSTSAPPVGFTPVTAAMNSFADVNSFLPPNDYEPNTTFDNIPNTTFLPQPTSSRPPEDSLVPNPTFLSQPTHTPNSMDPVARRRKLGKTRRSEEELRSFKDRASVIFGGPEQGNYFELAMWP
jgi:hypothetical protein